MREVAGSSPSVPTKLKKHLQLQVLFVFYEHPKKQKFRQSQSESQAARIIFPQVQTIQVHPIEKGETNESNRNRAAY